MATPFLGLRTTIYKVADIDAAKAWYTQVLHVPPYFDEPFYVGFNVAGYELGLQPEEHLPDKTVSVITYWGVDDIQKNYEALLALGAKAFETPQEVGGGIWVAAVKDPWDNVFGIIHNPHFTLS